MKGRGDGGAGLFFREAEVFSFVGGEADLFDGAVAAVEPEAPLEAVEEGERFVAGVGVPLPISWTDDGVGGVALPLGEAIGGAGEADLGMIFVAEADIKHQVGIAVMNDLGGGDLVFFPRVGGVGGEDGVGRKFCPGLAVGAGGVTDGVGLHLFACGIPHPEEAEGFVPLDVRAHHGDFFPRFGGGKDGFFGGALPVDAVGAGGVTDEGMAVGLSREPEVILVAFFEDDGAIDFIFPTALGMGAEGDLGFAPMDAVGAFDDGDALFGTPGKPHLVFAGGVEEADIETGAEFATEDGVGVGLYPARLGFWKG